MTGGVSVQNATSQDSVLAIASLGAIAEHLSQALYAKNRDGRLVLVNTKFCQLSGRQRDDMLGLTEAEIFGDNPQVAVAELEVLESQRAVQVSQRFPREDGAVVERWTSRVPLFDSAGELTHIVCTVAHSNVSRHSDDTAPSSGRGDLARADGAPLGDDATFSEPPDGELARYERERAQSMRSVQDQLLRKERLMVLGQLAAGLAHQIRNPLSAITNAIALARKQIPEGATTATEALKIANEEVWEANRIIADLLDYARIRPATRHPVGLLDLVSGAVEAEPLPDTVTVRYLLDDTLVFIDRRQVQDALRNLVRNAREAMDGVGTLSFSSKLEGDNIELCVEDTGVGVSVEHRHLLFEPLITSKPLGIGLGLPTARALIMNQGGTLECVDADSKGARFVVRLPIKERLSSPPP